MMVGVSILSNSNTKYLVLAGEMYLVAPDVGGDTGDMARYHRPILVFRQVLCQTIRLAEKEYHNS
jgi:hypothetical protein